MHTRVHILAADSCARPAPALARVSNSICAPTSISDSNARTIVASDPGTHANRVHTDVHAHAPIEITEVENEFGAWRSSLALDEIDRAAERSGLNIVRLRTVYNRTTEQQ